MKLALFSILALVAICGCARKGRVATYAEAKAVFVVGELPSEIEKKYGKPTAVTEFQNMIRWDYMPIKEIERGGKRSYSGFTIILTNGKASDIWEADTIAR